MLTYDLRPAGSENRYRVVSCRVVSCRVVQCSWTQVSSSTGRQAVTGSAPLSTVHFYTVQSAAVAGYCSALFQDLV